MMIYHIYQYELDFACTSASGNLYTLAKEKLNMSKFTKTLTAAAVAVAVSGPVAASDLNEGNQLGAYKGSKATVKITPSGCPNAKDKDIQLVVGFQELEPFAGCWILTGYNFDDSTGLEGGYIERKVGKDLTMSLEGNSFYEVLDEMYYYLDDESKCDFDDDDTLYDDPEVKKAQGKLSKNGEKLKVDMEVTSKYMTTNGKTKNVKAKVSGKLDYDSAQANPAWDCGFFLVQ